MENKCSLHHKVKGPTNLTGSHSWMETIGYTKCTHEESNVTVILQRARDHEVKAARPSDTLLGYLVRGTFRSHEGSYWDRRSTRPEKALRGNMSMGYLGFADTEGKSFQ